jgi:uncharacterized protein involved in exopolysaccharide biosynthesis
VVRQEYSSTRYGRRISLIEYFDVSGDTEDEKYQKALKLVRDLITVNVDVKTLLVTMTIELPEPELASGVLHDVIKQADAFLRKRQNASGSEQVRWIAGRIDTVEEELRSSEEALRLFREQNRRVIDSPELMLKQERLVRNVQIKSTIFVELKKQYELAKIEEVKSVSVINILDQGSTPVKKERPQRAINIVLSFFGSIFMYVFALGLQLSYGDKFSMFRATATHS